MAQEAYVRLLKLDEDRLVSYQRAYLFKVAQNLATYRLRKRDKQQTRANEDIHHSANEDIHHSDHSVTPNDQD